jgi:predicted dehydrogenase
MKIGVIGTGYWGPNIIRNLLALNQELVIYDNNNSNALSALKRFPECKAVSSLEDILHNPEIIAVAIVVQLRFHYQLVIDSLSAGKHVFVEKSLCYSSEEARYIQEHLNEKVLMVGHTTLFTPGTVKIKEFITKNSIGKITGISLTRTHMGPIYHEMDAATEVASHDIAILLFLLNDLPSTVNAWGSSRLGLNYVDSANIIIGYEDSLKPTINVQWTSVIRERMIVLEGTSGTIVCKTIQGKEELTLYNQQSVFEALKNGAKPQEVMPLLKSEEIKLRETEPLYDELQSFLLCIENNLNPLTNFDFSKKVVKVSEAIRKSMQLNGKTIDIQW